MKLNELEEIRPDPDRHWLVPRLIRAGCVTLIHGPAGCGRTLFCTELAIATATFTPMLGGPRPDAGGACLVATDDPHTTANTARRLLSGRNMRDADEITWMPRPERDTDFGLQLAAVTTQHFQAVVLDLAPTRGLCSLLTQQMATWEKQGTSVVVAQREDLDDWRQVARFDIGLSFDTVNNVLTCSPSMASQTSALLTYTKAKRAFVRVTTEGLSTMQYVVLGALHQLGPSTISKISTHLEIGPQTTMIRDALHALERAGLVVKTGQRKRSATWSYYIWAVAGADTSAA